MRPIADAAVTLGGRFNLIFHPHDHKLYQSAVGPFLEQPLDLTIGLRGADGRLWALPFTAGADHFPYVEQFGTLTTLTYRAVHPDIGVELVARVRAPFYPRNTGISTAPVYYLDIAVRRLAAFRHIPCESPLGHGEIVFALSGDGVEFERTERGFRYEFTSSGRAGRGVPPLRVTVPTWVESEDAEPFGDSEVRREFDLTAEETGRLSLIWSSWVDEPVLEVFGEQTRLKYTDVFESRAELLAWATAEKGRIAKRCDFLDRTFQDWSLGAAASDLTALAFHSFLINTWWTRRKDGRDWFSVWEGRCYYHSTIDVEYNDALLYFALWPELLEMLLDEWAEFEADGAGTLGPQGKGASFLCHDMGGDHVVGHQAYPHHMEVEETADYLLMLAAWAAFTGNVKQVAKKAALCRRLGEFLVRADTTGNGIPDAGTANTIDDASPAVQFGREQMYLAVKTQAALWALAEMEQQWDAKDSQAERWRAFASKGIKTLEEQAWLADHYAVTLTRSTKGLVNPWTGEPLAEGELAGWDDYSIYTANGLLYLFLANVKIPRWKLNRFAEDAENAARTTMTPYGCRHSSTSDRIVWFSQNMWRDYVAAYLGVDMLNNVERYWDYQVTTGGTWGASLYYDTTEQNFLSFYPRGATVFGMPLSAAGLSLSRLEGQLTLRPVRSTLRVPLLPLADWEQMRVPVLTVSRREGVSTARISERDLLEGLTVRTIGPELEPE